jgi:hypothetical protein
MISIAEVVLQVTLPSWRPALFGLVRLTILKRGPQLIIPTTIDRQGNKSELWDIIHKDGGLEFRDLLLDGLTVIS